MNEQLIASCGMNCGVCTGYLARKNDLRSQEVMMTYCAGCRARDKQCAFLKKRCELLMKGKVQYCYECEEFPCANLLKLDKRYRSNYRTSFVENLEYIRENGIDKFMERENEKWQCPECGEVICCHNGICYSCGVELLRERLRSKKNLYRWEK